MNEETQIKLMAYLDGELPQDEAAVIADLLKSDQEAAALVDELTWAKQAIAGNETEITVPETREFYWSKIARGIEAEERQAARESRPSDKWWYKLLMPATGFAALVGIFAVLNQPADPNNPVAPTTPVPVNEVDKPEDVTSEVSTYEFYAEEENMSVIWVNTDSAADFESPTRDRMTENQ